MQLNIFAAFLILASPGSALFYQNGVRSYETTNSRPSAFNRRGLSSTPQAYALFKAKRRIEKPGTLKPRSPLMRRLGEAQLKKASRASKAFRKPTPRSGKSEEKVASRASKKFKKPN